MRRFTAAGAGIAVLAILGWLLFFREERSSPRIRPRAEGNIVALGDSLTMGVGSSVGNDYPSVLSRRLGVEIINAGRYGDTAADALLRLDEVLAKDPRLVIVLLGGNDALHRLPVDVTFENLGEILDRLAEVKVAVLMLGIQRGVFLDDYPRRFEELVREKNVEFIPTILQGIYGNPDFMADGIHPNDRGYEMMVDRIEPVLRRMLEIAN